MPSLRRLEHLAPELRRWTGPHPEWRAGDFGAAVGSYALATEPSLLLVDPLLPQDDDAAEVEADLEDLARGRAVHVLITIGYHVRSASTLRDRLGAQLWGPPTLGARLDDPDGYRVLEPGDTGPEGVVAQGIGRPRRSERPLWFPSHDALAFGDAVVTTPTGDLRLWSPKPLDAGVRAHYAERVGPSMQPLVDLAPKRILTTHGAPVLAGGHAALRRAVVAGPWYHAG